MAAPPVVRFLDFGQYKYELTKREKEAKRKQRSVTFKEVRLKPKIGIGRLRHEGSPGDPVPRGRRPDQGLRPVPGPRADPPRDRAQPAGPVHGADQGPRRRGTGSAAGGQVDAHHGGIDPQAQGARADPARRRGSAGTDGRRHRGPGGRRCQAGGSGRRRRSRQHQSPPWRRSPRRPNQPKQEPSRARRANRRKQRPRRPSSKPLQRHRPGRQQPSQGTARAGRRTESRTSPGGAPEQRQTPSAPRRQPNGLRERLEPPKRSQGDAKPAAAAKSTAKPEAASAATTGE